MVRVLFAGDTHGVTSHVDYLLRRADAEACQTVFVVGDFGFWEHEHEGRVFLDKVDRLARNRGLVVAALDGNHDNWPLLLERHSERDEDGLVVVREHVRYAPRGHRWTWGSTRILALGGAASLDKQWRLDHEARRTAKARRKASFRSRTDGPSASVRDYAGTLWFPDEELTDELVDRVLAEGPVIDLLLTHDKPRRSRLGSHRKDVAEAWPNQERIQRVVDGLHPPWMIHGHLHVRYRDQVGATTVDGLACDPEAGWGLTGYRREDSWIASDL